MRTKHIIHVKCSYLVSIIISGVFLSFIAACGNLMSKYGMDKDPATIGTTRFDSSEQDADGMTPMHWAVFQNRQEDVRKFLAKGADPNVEDKFGITVLRLAAGEGRVEIVGILLEKGADIDKEDSDGMTALHYAAQRGHLAVVKLLLEKGADIDKKDKSGHTPLYLARKKNYSEIETIFDTIKSKASI